MNRLATRLLKGQLSMAQRRLDTAITTILITSNDWALKSQCLDALNEGRYRIDSRLVLGLYQACDERQRIELACQPGISRMPPRAFRQLFNDAYWLSNLSNERRRYLAWSLEGFLTRHPRQILEFEPVILGLLRSPHPALRSRGLTLAGRLQRLAKQDLAIVVRSMRSRSSELRMNALAGLCMMADRLKALALPLRESLASNELRALVLRLHRSDPDEAVRRNAGYLERRLVRMTKQGPPA